MDDPVQSGGTPDRTAFGGLAIRAAVALLPRRFRATYAADMVDLYRERRDAAAGRAARYVLLTRTLVDLARTALAEHRHSSFLPGTLSEVPRRDGDGPLKSLIYDLRHAARAARKRPGYGAIVVLTLALGIGAATAIFTVVNGVLLQPLPYEDPDGLFIVYGRFDPESGFDYPEFPVSPPEFIDYRDQTEAMEAVAAVRGEGVTVTEEGSLPERVLASLVSVDLLPLLGVEPLLGRSFTVEEDLPGGDPVAILEYGYWRARFAGSEDVLGTSIRVDGVERTIIGVMPEGFDFPFQRTRLWMPLGIDPADTALRQSHGITVIARLASGVDRRAADAEMQVLMKAWKEQYPDIHTGHYLFLAPMLEEIVERVRPALLTLLAASGFVVLIVCANVGSILLARSEDRGREVAIRAALGAHRSRLVQLVLAESVLLSGVGGLLGIVVAHLGVRLLFGLDEGGIIPRSAMVGIDLSVLGFALATTGFTAVLFTLAPAVQTAAIDLRSQLVEGRTAVSASARRLMLRRLLVTAEVALSFMLVVGAGLMIRSLGELMRVEPGFRTDGVLVAGLFLPATDYPEDAEVNAFYDRVVERIGTLPGVVSASASTAVPLWSGNGVWDFEVERVGNALPDGTRFSAAFRSASPGYFETMGERIVRGRAFEASDSNDSEPVALVSEGLARRFFAGEDPIGRRIRVSGDGNAWARVVGIVGDVRDDGLDADPEPAYYLATAQTLQTVQHARRRMGLVLRTRGEPESLLPDLRRAVAELDPNLPLIEPQSMESVVAESVAQPRFTTFLLTLFALVAIVLGASGIYGVLAYSVAQRTREIGIRKALGAQVGGLVRLVLVQGMMPVAWGLVLGGIGALALGRLMTTLLFGVSPADASTFAAVAATLTVAAVVACWAPALRAARLDPLIALRAE